MRDKTGTVVFLALLVVGLAGCNSSSSAPSDAGTVSCESNPFYGTWSASLCSFNGSTSSATLCGESLEMTTTYGTCQTDERVKKSVGKIVVGADSAVVAGAVEVDLHYTNFYLQPFTQAEVTNANTSCPALAGTFQVGKETEVTGACGQSPYVEYTLMKKDGNDLGFGGSDGAGHDGTTAAKRHVLLDHVLKKQ
jgi:hypothetical protein